MDGITIVDVAEKAGVSVSTVSRVMNNHPNVSEKTRHKVHNIINEYGYIPNNSARNLKRESLKAIGVIVKGFSNPFFISMLSIIQKELEEKRYIMILHQVQEDQDEVIAAISLCKEKKPHGLIFMGGNFEHSSKKLAMLQLPYVMLTITLHGAVDRTCFSSVTIDDYAAGYAITDKICKLGHKKIAAIGFSPEDISVSRLRITGFLQALHDNNINIGQDPVWYAKEYTMRAGYDTTTQLLNHGPFTCLFCISDTLALGALRALHDAGLSVPQDISLVGFDGIDAGRYSTPSLATMRQPIAQMAHKSVQVLLSHLRQGTPHCHLLFEGEFLAGESFAALR